MLELEATASDDTAFLALCGRLIAGAAVANGFSDLVVCRIDHWFGPRWLGFCGKILGAAGVRNRRLIDELTPPPFHPHRVSSVREYRRSPLQGFECRGEVGWLHGLRTSEQNLGRHLRRGRLYAWYSGDTVVLDRGVVMVYLVQRAWNTAWYVGFDKTPLWHPAQSRAIAPWRVHELLEGVSPRRTPA
jgi:hypothetical protein